MEIAVHQWVRIDLGSDSFIAFTYRDPTAGPSAKGGPASEPATPEQAEALVASPGHTFRLPIGTITPLSPAEIARLQLPDEPWWLEHYKPEVKPWHSDPALAGRFHPAYPDDTQAQFCFVADREVEQMWVRLVGVAPDVHGYEAALLNQPHNPNADLAPGARVTIRVTPGVSDPIWVTDTMRANLQRYRGACEGCGFDLVMAPIDDLIRAQFPDVPAGAEMMTFTTRCGRCGQTQVLERVTS